MSYQGPTPPGEPAPRPGDGQSHQPVSGQPVSGQPVSGQPGYGAPPVPGGMSTADERTMAMFAHLSAIVASLVVGLAFLGPLIIYLMKKDESPFVRHHGREALNLSISATIVTFGIAIASCVLSFVVIGIFTFFLIPIYGIAVMIMLIMGGIAANKGEWYRYPEWLAWPIVK